jgi:predicted flavoprotein YhiN
VDGNETGAAAGELLFTKYGLSGTAILDISEYVSIALNRIIKGR